jgi:hypothetical protein
MARIRNRVKLWDQEEDLFIKRRDTVRLQKRGGLKFNQVNDDGTFDYKLIKSKKLGGHHVHVSNALRHYKLSK